MKVGAACDYQRIQIKQKSSLHRTFICLHEVDRVYHSSSEDAISVPRWKVR